MRQKDLNRRILSSHCLSARMKGRDPAVKVANACCGIQSQSFSASLTSFWARIDRFRNDNVLSELRPGGGLVRSWLVRGTLHTVPSKDYDVFIYGGASERMLKWIDTIAKKRRAPPREKRWKVLYEPFLDEIKGRPVTEENVRTFMDGRARRLGLKRGAWTGLGEMAFSGLLVPAGRERASSMWMRTSDWIPRRTRPPDRETCRAELVRKYIARHGPVSKEDILYWAYLTKTQLDQALGDLAGDLVEVKVEDSKDPYIALDEGRDEETPRPPRVIVLPRYDSLLLSLKDKTRFMDMAHYKRIFPKIPVGMVEATVLVDGFVTATWRRAAKKGSRSIEVHPFRELAARDKRAIEAGLSDYGVYAGFTPSVVWA